MGWRPLDDWGFLLDCENGPATHSKDPSTKVGAIIVRPDRTKASEGFNGFPRGVHDLPSRYNRRETKYAFVVHAELNAILNAREPLHGMTLYCTLSPCHECAKAIIQSGIKRVVTWNRNNADRDARWHLSHTIAATMFREANVTVDYLDRSHVETLGETTAYDPST